MFLCKKLMLGNILHSPFYNFFFEVLKAPKIIKVKSEMNQKRLLNLSGDAFKYYVKNSTFGDYTLLDIIDSVRLIRKNLNQFVRIHGILRLNIWIIAVIGNIGVGKTTLCKNLCLHFGKKNAIFVPETVKEPLFQQYITEQYKGEKDKNSAFKLQTFILATFTLRIIKTSIAVTSMTDYRNNVKVLVIERTFLEEKLFRKVLFENGMLTKLQFDNLEVFSSMCVSILRPLNLLVPDLVIALKVPTVVTIERIKKRALKRKSESTISIVYLNQLDKEYEALIDFYASGGTRNENPSTIVREYAGAEYESKLEITAEDLLWFANIFPDYDNIPFFIKKFYE